MEGASVFGTALLGVGPSLPPLTSGMLSLTF